MSDNGQRERIESGYTWIRFILWAIVLAAVLFYQAQPQQLGQFGWDWIFLGAGSLFVFSTLLDVRSGTSTLLYSTYKRSEDSTGFWTYVVINGVLGGLFIFGTLGDLLGLWRL